MYNYLLLFHLYSLHSHPIWHELQQYFSQTIHILVLHCYQLIYNDIFKSLHEKQSHKKIKKTKNEKASNKKEQ